MTQPNTTLSNTAAIQLIMSREVSVRLRSRVWRVVTIVMVAIVVLLCVLLKLLHGNNPGLNVGYVAGNPTDTAVATQLPAVAAPLGTTVHVKAVPDQATGEQLVNAGTLDGLLTDSGGHLTVTVKKSIDAGLRTAVDQLSTRVALARQIQALGGDPVRVLQTTAAAGDVTVHPLQPPFPYRTAQLILGIIAGVLVYISLVFNGQTVAQGVVEEKSSRVVELLLATIRPWQLMAGKVLGIGIVGLIQILAIGVVGIAAGLATKVLNISVSAAAGTVVWLVVWYLLGFFMYSIVFAGLGALVSRQEDIGGVVAPATLFLVAGYVMGSSILPSNPGSQLIAVMSVIPMFAPTLMPMRLAMGGVPAWQAILAVGLVVVLIPLLIWLAARIYRNAVLRTGARVKLSQALRAA
jgi:ABC-2 type transport system permease protein